MFRAALGFVPVAAAPLVLEGEVLEVGPQLVEGGGELGLFAEQGLEFVGGEGARSVAVDAGELGLAGDRWINTVLWAGSAIRVGCGGAADPAAKLFRHGHLPRVASRLYVPRIRHIFLY